MPDRPHEVLVVGAGSIGERHIRCFLATGRACVSFAEVRDSLRVEIASRYPGAVPFPSLDAALERTRATVAVVATPAHLHIPQTAQLIEHGIHVLVEKPLSVATAGIKPLLAAVRARKLTAGVAYVYRAHPVLAEMRQAIRSGRFGRPVQLVAVCGQHFPLYRPGYAETYYARRDSGGGAVQDALTHIINAGQWLAGDIDRVVADVAHQVVPKVDVEDTAHVLARHGNVLASYSLNQHQAPNEVTITIVCERGTTRFEFHNCRWRCMERPGGEWTDHTGDTLERDTLFTHQAHAFLDAVEGKAATACSLEEGLATLRANVAILKSHEQRAWQEMAGD